MASQSSEREPYAEWRDTWVDHIESPRLEYVLSGQAHYMPDWRNTRATVGSTDIPFLERAALHALRHNERVPTYPFDQPAYGYFDTRLTHEEVVELANFYAKVGLRIVEEFNAAH